MNRALACSGISGIAPALRGGAMSVALLIGLAAPTARAEDVQPDAAAAAPAVRKVVIGSFTGKAGQDARAIALQQIAGRTDRNDYTVIGYDDAQVVAKRLGVAIDSADGRRAISAELAIDAWLDGELDAEGEGELRLSGGDGKRIASLPLHGDNAREARELLGEKLWPWIGPRISDQERIARRLQEERTRALEKVAAREQELGHQRQLVLEREQRRMKLLAAAHARAREKQTAREQEIARQVQIVRERELAIAREQQRQREEMERQQAELARQQAEQERQLAEQQRQLALEQQRQQAEQQRQLALEEQRRLAQERAAMQAAAASKAAPPDEPGGDVWQPAPAQAQWPTAAPAAAAPATATWQPPRAKWGQPAAQPAAVAQRGGARRQPSQAQPAPSRFQPAPGRFQPAPAQGLEPAPAASGGEPPMIEGISPETREWLLRKQRERAGAGGGGSYQ